MGRQEVAIFWDYAENCPSPTGWSGYEVVKRIRGLVQEFGPVKLFKAYLSISEQSSQPSKATLRSELQASGVSLTDTPHNGRKEVADKMIIVDMLTHAMDNPAPATILLISGDRDYAYAISVLRLRQYDIVLFTNSNAHSSLTSQASVTFDWAADILGTVEPAASASSSSECVTGPNDFRFPSLKFVPVPKSPSKPSYSTASPSKRTGKEAYDCDAKGSSAVEGFSLRSPVQVNFDFLRPNPSSSIDLVPPSPTEDLFSGFHRSPSRPPLSTQDPFPTASRSYPSPQLSSVSLSAGAPDTPISFQDSTFQTCFPSDIAASDAVAAIRRLAAPRSTIQQMLAFWNSNQTTNQAFVNNGDAHTQREYRNGLHRQGVQPVDSAFLDGEAVVKAILVEMFKGIIDGRFRTIVVISSSTSLEYAANQLRDRHLRVNFYNSWAAVLAAASSVGSPSGDTSPGEPPVVGNAASHGLPAPSTQELGQVGHTTNAISGGAPALPPLPPYTARPPAEIDP
ncbi:hypothetical protein MD484_g3172, partial [Candolleomyces efflorescens]